MFFKKTEAQTGLIVSCLGLFFCNHIIQQDRSVLNSATISKAAITLIFKKILDRGPTEDILRRQIN